MSVKFNLGDTVKLKSGGPVMTVSQTHEKNSKAKPGYTIDDNHVYCTWFVDQIPHEGLFHIDTLEKWN